MRANKARAGRRTGKAWVEVPALMRELQENGSSGAKALQWTILTAARAGETLGASRSEIKTPREFARIARFPLTLVKGETWVIPAERMKEGKSTMCRLQKKHWSS